MSLQTPLEKFYQHVTERPDDIYFRQPVDGKVIEMSWQDVNDQVRRTVTALQQMDLPKGSHIGLFSKNCAEWFIADLAIMMGGFVSIPIFPTAGENTIQYVLKHADVKAIFVGKLDSAEQQMQAIPDDVLTIGFPYHQLPYDHTWQQVQQHQPFEGMPKPALDDIMTIIYTSGSTGNPKGVVHEYSSISWVGQNCLAALSINKDDRLLSYLPLAHITERVLIEAASLYAGLQVSFIESLDTFTRDVKEADPTLFISVPRLWVRFQMGILAKIPQKKLDFILRIPFVGKAIARKIRKQLGLDSARLWASGSAPISPSTIHWFHKIGINISEGWGMTENSAYGTSSVPFRADKIGSIGRAYDGVDIRISDEGEIQVKGPCNMKEYYLEPEKTAEVFTEDGYLRTGDKGEMDSEGYIRITGRLKDMFKTAKGKYVVPVPIESKLMENPVIEQVCVTGCNLKQPVALVVLSEMAAQHSREELTESLEDTLTSVNKGLESHAVLDHILVANEEWTIENDLLTPTLKIKRHIIEARYQDEINGNYGQPVVWLER